MLRLSNNILSIPAIKTFAYEHLSAAGVESVEDLLLLRPKKYQDKRDIKNFSSIEDKGDINTFVRVLSVQTISSSIPKVIVEDLADPSPAPLKLKRATIMAFGRSYIKSYVKAGNIYHLYGTATRKSDFANSLQITKFDIKPVESTDGSRFYSKSFGELKPLFFLSNAMLNNKVCNACEYILEHLDYDDKELDVVNKFLENHSLLPLKEALRLKLFPSDYYDIELSRRTFAGFEISKNFECKPTANSYTPAELGKEEEKFISSLPFNLTQSQRQAVIEIISSLNEKTPTQRLLQGEVGSGKTIVAFISAYNQILKKKQVAMIAPTEILSFQHYTNAKKFFSSTNVKIEYMSSSTKPKERGNILSRLKNGDIDFLIGTHSILSAGLEFKNLSFAIIDEEQRFGALQKENISLKGECVHLLFASATPIPRSIMKIFSNRVSISTLEAISDGRIPVKTFLVSPARRLEAYRTIIPEFEKGHCAYFIVPRIEDEDTEKKNIASLEKELSDIFVGVPHAVIHSKLKDDEKKEIFMKFMAGDIKYLVATSVVEVGMDNKNATVVFIEDADLFGLSTLHQLRGRVGRGGLASWCFLSYRQGITDSGKERLRVIKDTTDGFAIAEKDLELRGSGDLLGTKQSGRSILNYFDAEKDLDLID